MRAKSKAVNNLKNFNKSAKTKTIKQKNLEKNI